MALNSEEWIKQAEYDMASAEYMHAGNRNYHAVFFCHLAIEKALKGIVHKKTEIDPPKIHSLSYLREIAGIQPPLEIVTFLSELNNLSTLTRYPETLLKMEESFNDQRTKDIIGKGKKSLQWLQDEFRKS